MPKQVASSATIAAIASTIFEEQTVAIRLGESKQHFRQTGAATKASG